MNLCIWLFPLKFNIDFNCNWQAEGVNVQHQSSQNKEHSYITPFLASNQLPGPFRPILSSRNATKQSQIQQNNAFNQHPLSPFNTILRQPPPLPKLPPPPALPSNHKIEILPETNKPIYYSPQQSKQQKYPTYLHPQTQYIQLVTSTEQPITNNNIDEPIQVIPANKHTPKPIFGYTKVKPVTQTIYTAQQPNIQSAGAQHTSNIQNVNLHTRVK